MSLPPAQSRVLRFVAAGARVTAWEAARALQMDQVLAEKSLTLLAGEGLVDEDVSTVPTSYTVTYEGLEALSNDFPEEDPHGHPVP